MFKHCNYYSSSYNKLSFEKEGGIEFIILYFLLEPGVGNGLCMRGR